MVVFMFVVCIFCRFLLFLLAVPSFPTRRSSDLGWQLHLGNHSTLVPSAKAYADGVVYALTPNELAALYKRDGICAFEPQEIEVYLLQEKRFSSAVCYFAVEGPSMQPPPNKKHVEQMITSMQQQRLDASTAERWLYL